MLVLERYYIDQDKGKIGRCKEMVTARYWVFPNLPTCEFVHFNSLNLIIGHILA